MRKLLTRFALLLAAIASPLLIVDATACTCGPPSSPYREYQESKVVFVGKVLSSKDHSVTEKILDDKKFDWVITDVMGRFSLQAFVGAEYWVHGISNSSGQGEPVKINVQMVNEPLKVVVPFPKRIDQ